MDLWENPIPNLNEGAAKCDAAKTKHPKKK